MASYLPEEVVVKILSRLPPKSLIRFKCVSQRWRALIEYPYFLSKNLLNHFIITQNSNDPLHHIIFFAQDYTGNLIHSFRSYNSLHCASQTPVNLPTERNIDIVASCNGLLCLWDYVQEDVYLWNPATSSELKPLPASSSCGRLAEVIDYEFHVGFGFDSVSNDYKVIRILMVVGEYVETWDEVEIYSLRCGSWKQLDLGVPLRMCKDLRSMALNGVFLWYSNDEIIVAFDFGNEEFRTMLFPDAQFFCDYGICMRTVTELKGSLAMLVFPCEVRKKKMYLDVWVMLEFGVRESWTRLLSIQLPLHLERPLGFWKNGELFMQNSEGQVVLYDLLAQTETDLQFEVFPGTLKVFDYNFVQFEGLESGVISTPPCSSCSSQLHYAIDFNDHEDCRRKQQETDRKLEETQISLQDMQERTVKMEEDMAKMREKMDMLMALVSRHGGSFGGDPSQDNQWVGCSCK